MRVTRYPQSCLVVEADGSKLLIDPGTLVSASYALDDLPAVDAVLFTHRHADHLDADWAAQLRERGLELFGNADVAGALREGGDATTADAVTEVADGKAFTAAGVEVVAHDLEHVVMVDGSPGPPNTGFLVDGTLFHPGDGVEIGGLRSPLTAPALAAPIAGPSISFRDAYKMVAEIGASTVVPIHYDYFIADPDQFAGAAADLADVRVLAEGQSTEL